MLNSRLRNGKLRIVVMVSIGLGILFTIYVLRDTHVKLNESKLMSEKCQVQQDSLSAQLQVAFEQKTRLEKSLDQEKLERLKVKSDAQAQCERTREIDKHEANNRFNSLQQQHKMLQIQMEDLQEELNKVQQVNVNLLQEKQQLVDSQNMHLDMAKQRDMEVNGVKLQLEDCKQKIVDISKQFMDKKQKLIESQLMLSTCEKKIQQSSLNQSITISTVKDGVIKDDLKDQHVIINNSISNMNLKNKEEKSIKTDDQNKQVQQPAIFGFPPVDNLVNHDEEKRPEHEEFQRNGLEQQENGGDQDLDNMEDEDNEEGEGAAQQQQPPQNDEGKAFDDADFDQLYEGKLGPKDSAPLDAAH